jgi:hypothetical protein
MDGICTRAEVAIGIGSRAASLMKGSIYQRFAHRGDQHLFYHLPALSQREEATTRDQSDAPFLCKSFSCIDEAVQECIIIICDGDDLGLCCSDSKLAYQRKCPCLLSVGITRGPGKEAFDCNEAERRQ